MFSTLKGSQSNVSATPSGSEFIRVTVSGGVAALNHRLLSATPPGSNPDGLTRNEIHGLDETVHVPRHPPKGLLERSRPRPDWQPLILLAALAIHGLRFDRTL